MLAKPHQLDKLLPADFDPEDRSLGNQNYYCHAWNFFKFAITLMF
jgi:hypothetical protein